MNRFASGTFSPLPSHQSRFRGPKSVGRLNVRPRIALRYRFDLRLYPPALSLSPAGEYQVRFGTVLKLASKW